jgi:DedD protein
VADPRTHYQVSFTARQAILFFAVFLGALAGAYFLGVATGIAGRPVAESVSAAAATPAPAPLATQAPSRKAATPVQAIPTAVPEAKSSPAAMAAREPSSAGGIQFFEDRPEETPSSATAPKKKQAAAPPASEGFWIQVLSTGSEKEASARRAHLAEKGYRAAVSPTRGPGGATLYRVRVGPYPSKEEASKASEGLVRKEKVKTWIVPPGE